MSNLTPQNAWNNRQGTGINRPSGPVVAEVMRNDDPLRSGRILVYSGEFGGSSDNPDNWLLANYMSPYYGIQPLANSTQEANLNKNYPNRESYGWWMTPPDVGVKVVILFLNDDRSSAVWIGCLPEIGSHGAVPAQDKGDFDISLGDVQNRFSVNPDSVERPEHSTRPQFTKQGIANDPFRGTITSSSLRESPSRVFGFNTPGSHSFVMDDGEEDGTNNLVRIRSGAGNQITMNDESGLIYIINRDGTGWIEISPTGHIDVYGASGINLATAGSINMHANNNINMHAGNSIKIVGNTSTKIQGSQELQLTGGTLKATGNSGVDIYSDGAVALKAGGDFAVNAANVVMKGGCFKWNSGAARQARCVPLESTGTKSGYQTTVTRAPSKEPYNEHDNGSGNAAANAGNNATNSTVQSTSGNSNTPTNGIISSGATALGGQAITGTPNNSSTSATNSIVNQVSPVSRVAVTESTSAQSPNNRSLEDKVDRYSNESTRNNLTVSTPETSRQAAVSGERPTTNNFINNAKRTKVLFDKIESTVNNPEISNIVDTVENLGNFVNNVIQSPIGTAAKSIGNAASAIFGTNSSPVDIATNISGSAFSALQNIANDTIGNSLLSSNGLGGFGGISRGCGGAANRGAVTSGTKQNSVKTTNQSKDGLVDRTSIEELKSNPQWSAKIAEMERKYPGFSEEQIYRVIQGESKFNLKAKNSRGSATGLFQFIESTANGLGYTTGEIQQMNAVQQLEVYDQYLQDNNYQGGPLGIMQAAPSFADRPVNAVIYAKGSEEWRENPPWRDPRTGEITVGSINAYYGY